MKKFKNKIGSKYTPKRTKLHHFRNFSRRVLPPNTPSKAHGFAMRSMSLCDMQISKSRKKFLVPPPKSWLRPWLSSDVWGGGALGERQNPTKNKDVPSLSLRLLSNVASGERGGGAPKSYKRLWCPLSVIKKNKYCGVRGVWGGGGRHWGGAKILQKLMVPPLSVIKINKYCGVGRSG